jgi:hydrogenase 3 maturation protease
VRLAVLAVGSELRGDDAAGILAGGALADALAKKPPAFACQVFLGHSAPENLTGAVRQFGPTHLLVLDAAQSNAPPGGVAVLDEQMIAANASASTHSLPLAVVIDYLVELTSCKAMVIGIQPGNLELGGGVSPAVEAAAKELAQTLAAICNQG